MCTGCLILKDCPDKQVGGSSNNSKALNVDTLNCLFCFVALCPKSTAMVIAGRSVHLTTLFPGQA